MSNDPFKPTLDAYREFCACAITLQQSADVDDWCAFGIAWTVARINVTRALDTATRAELHDLQETFESADETLRSPVLRTTYGRFLDQYATALADSDRAVRIKAGDLGTVIEELRGIRRLIEKPVEAVRDKEGNVIQAIRQPEPAHIVMPHHPDFDRLQAFVSAGVPTVQPLARSRFAIPECGDDAKLLGAYVHDLKTCAITHCRLGA